MRWIALVLGLAIAYHALSSSASAAPALQLPWATGEQHRINSGGYSYNCGGHTGSSQYAIDFEFYVGQSVAVAALGTVVEAVDNNLSNGGRGNYLTVDHGGGFVSRYLHLRLKTQDTPTFAPGIAPGASVNYGVVAAYSGNTGGVEAHLHFDLKLNGAAYMPEPMSGITGFGQYGLCTGLTSPYWTSVTLFTHYQPIAGFINSDGYGDIGLRDFNNGVFYIRYGDSGSSFSGETQYAWGALGAHYEPFTADFNANGCGDIGLRDPNNGVFYIQYGNCAGGFGSQTAFWWAPGFHYKPFVCDVNGNGKPDIGLRDPNNGVFYVKYGDGSGSFTGQTQYTWAVGAHYQPFARDFNNDNKCDIGLRDPNNGVFYILFGNGSGSWFGNQITHEWAPGYQYAPFTMKRYSYVLGNIGLKDPNNGVWYIRFYIGGSSFCCETQYPWAPG